MGIPAKVPTFGIALLISLWAVPSGGASDWEEEGGPARRDSATNDKVSLPASGPPVLQGTATTVRTLVPPSSSAQAALQQNRDREVYAIDAEADRFLSGAQTNVPAPPEVFRNWIRQNHPELQGSAESSNPGLVLNVKGQWDSSAKPLTSLGIKHTSIKEKALKDIPLDGARVLIVNCAGTVPRDALQRIRDWVGRGGYLVTTDWALENLVQKAFPNYIIWNGENTSGDVVDAYVVDPDPILFKGVSGRRFTWKLDKGSQTVKIINTKRVRVLVRSSRLAQMDPNLRVLPDRMMAGPVALEFSFGRGKVLHLVGHYDNCGDREHRLPDPAPGAGISLRQVLITNFVLEGLKGPAVSGPE